MAQGLQNPADVFIVASSASIAHRVATAIPLFTIQGLLRLWQCLMNSLSGWDLGHPVVDGLAWSADLGFSEQLERSWARVIEPHLVGWVRDAAL